jgi:hypothetical protein
MIDFIRHNWHSLLWSAGILAAAVAVALVARGVLFWLLQRITRKRGTLLGHSLVRHGAGPAYWILPLLAVLAVLPGLPRQRTAQKRVGA